MRAAKLGHRRGRKLLPAVALVFLLAPPRLAGQNLAAGRCLVASRLVSDPRFAETVVLLIHHDQSSAMGLIINRRSTQSLARLFPGMGRTANRSDPVYLGGPVGRTRVLALARSRVSPDGATRILADVHLISERVNLERTLAAGAGSGVFRVYLGYAGWTTGRLEREVAAGLWHILAGDAGLVFDPEPESLWKRLMRRFEGPKASTPQATEPVGASCHREGFEACVAPAWAVKTGAAGFLTIS